MLMEIEIQMAMNFCYYIGKTNHNVQVKYSTINYVYNLIS